ncbi:MAG TPA: ThuA domain-containing protein [candidate division Zixibacteria bacterium]|nr:ThuA domain-containing protein [candidate division Zixibacteria bacterium]
MRKLLFLMLTLTAAILLVVSCSDDEPTAPVPVPAKILILEDGGTEDTLQLFLDSAGFDVTMGGLYSNYTGTNFSAYDLVIFLNGVQHTNVMADSIQQALKNYVMGGGVLLITEWMVYDGNTVILDSLSLVTSGASYNDGFEAYLKQLDHPIAAGLPDSFDLPSPDWYWVQTFAKPTSLCTNIQSIYNGVSATSPQLLIGTFGSGRMIHWAMPGQANGADIWYPEVRRIFINIAAFSKTI